MGNTPESPKELASRDLNSDITAAGKVEAQAWYRWLGIYNTLWAALVPIYAVLRHFLKWLPVWDAGTGAPRWFDLILTYFCIPVAILGAYSFFAVLVSIISTIVTRRTGRPQILWYDAVFGGSLGTIYLGYVSSTNNPGAFFVLPFLFGLLVLFLFAVQVKSRMSQHH